MLFNFVDKVVKFCPHGFQMFRNRAVVLEAEPVGNFRLRVPDLPQADYLGVRVVQRLAECILTSALSHKKPCCNAKQGYGSSAECEPEPMSHNKLGGDDDAIQNGPDCNGNHELETPIYERAKFAAGRDFPCRFMRDCLNHGEYDVFPQGIDRQP